jgi:hypothetical protein
MTTIEELNLLNDFDDLQYQLTQPNMIENARRFLKDKNVNPDYARHYLTSKMFFKFKEHFPNISAEFYECISAVYHDEDLSNNITRYINFLSQWKKKDIDDTLIELSEMKQHTQSSSAETDNNDCKICYENQESILIEAEKFYMFLKERSQT